MYLVLSSLEMQIRPMQTKVYNNSTSFLIYLEKKDSQNFKCSSCCTFSPVSVYVVRATCFDECFLFHVTLFLKRFIATMRFFFNHHVTTFLKRNVLKEVRILHYLHSNSTILIGSSEKVVICILYIFFLFNFIFDTTLSFFDCPTFLIVNKIYSKISKPLWKGIFFSCYHKW